MSGCRHGARWGRPERARGTRRRHSQSTSKHPTYRSQTLSARASLRGAARRGNRREPGLSFTGIGTGVLTARAPISGWPGARRLPRRSGIRIPALLCFEPEARLAILRSPSSITPRNDAYFSWVGATGPAAGRSVRNAGDLFRTAYRSTRSIRCAARSGGATATPSRPCGITTGVPGSGGAFAPPSLSMVWLLLGMSALAMLVLCLLVRRISQESRPSHPARIGGGRRLRDHDALLRPLRA